MTSYAPTTWAEPSQLLPTQENSKSHPVQWQQQQVHTDSHADGHPSRNGHTQPYPYTASESSVGTLPAHKPTILQRLGATWVFELFGLAVSAASLAAMVYVLRRYDGQRIPDWGSLSFNTVISILAVVSKMAALYGATSAISQLKWVWFTAHGKNLADYKTFDSGSRGMSGAAMLAWSFKGRNAAVIGALAIVIGAAAGPFAQQIVHFYDAEYVDVARSAWLARAQVVDSFGPKRDSSTWTLDPIFKANGNTALFLPTQEVLSQPRFQCPSGNCTWAPFSTLGFCSTCVDLSSQLKRSCEPVNSDTTVQSCTIAFPGDSEKSLRLFYIADPDYPGTSTYMVLNATTPADATVLKNITWAPRVYQSIRADVSPYQLGGTQNPNLETSGELVNSGVHVLKTDTPFIGSECALSPCVRRMQASVVRGDYSETVLDTFSDLGTYMYPDPIVLSPPWEEQDTNFTIHPEWVEAVWAVIDPGSDIFGGRMMGYVSTQDSNQGIGVYDIPYFDSFARQNDALQAIFYAGFNVTTCPTPHDNVACAFRALAAALTKSVRDAGVLRNGTDVPYVVQGAVNNVGTFIRIEWPWFALPVAIWALSLVTVVVAMWKSRSVPLWRDSVLPLVLLYGEHAGMNGGVKEAALSARAETVKLHLAGDQKEGLKILTKAQ